MLPLVLAFGSGMAWGTADFLGGLSARTLPLVTVSLVSQAAGLAFLVIVVVVRGEGPSDVDALLLGLAGGLAGAGGLSALYRALAVGRMSIVAPTAALSGTVPVAWGLLRGERPGTIQLIGVAVAIAGIVLAARTRDRSGERTTAGPGSPSWPRRSVRSSCCSTRPGGATRRGRRSWCGSARSRSSAWRT
jgi:drug/metabolite transporter (DMT)-like permease